MTEKEMLEARYFYGLLAAAEMIPFCRLTWPDPNAPADVNKSRFEVAGHHEFVASELERVDSGECQRLILVMPRRHGKTELSVRRFVPWSQGRHPAQHVIVATYSDTFSEEHGRAVRNCMVSPSYRVAFPAKDSQLRDDSQSSARLQTQAGGILSFVGRGGSITGKGADLIVLDDLLKDQEEAQSLLVRDKVWEWIHTVILNSFNTIAGRLVLLGTRWSEDDPIGRFTDPRNPHYDATEAAKWRVIRLPALAEDFDPLERSKDEALWPSRLPAEIYTAKRESSDQTVKRSFITMDQGRPTPDEGTFFKSEYLVTYRPEELPKRLRYYAASDHAVSIEQDADLTCLLPAGVCEKGDLWVLPDVWWRRADSKDTVQAMIELMRRFHPLFWWAEKGHISKAIGPFLRDRMQEEEVNCAVIEVTPIKDKQTRSQSMQGRCAMRRVHFPGFSPWWPDAVDELLKFPNGAHDDFVDALAHLGMGLDRLVAAEGPAALKPHAPKTGTIEWVKYSSKLNEWRNKQRKETVGF